MSIRLIAPQPVERPWGTKRLSPLFPDSEEDIGEIWFDVGPSFPLLVKFLFTGEALSVQVHPDDEYALRVENSRGKTEMWHILSAQPGATISLGFTDEFPLQEIRAAAASKDLVAKLQRVSVKPGDTFLVEAGIVHAIGAGLVLCEIQQNSDITYRLYDYDSGRELHIEKSLAVAKTGKYDGRREFPVVSSRFTADLLDLQRASTCGIDRDGVFIALEGSGKIGDVPISAGQVAFVTAEQISVTINPQKRLKLLHARGATEA